MSRFPGLCVLTCWSFLAFLSLGCPIPASAADDQDDIEGQVERSMMFTQHARIDPKTGFRIPINDKIDIATPADIVTGIQAAFEAIDRGIWFGLEFDYSLFQIASGVNPDLVTGDTEGLMTEFDRYDILFTFDYDIPLGDHLPDVEKSGFDFYSPVFTFGLGLGAAIINAAETDAARETRKFDPEYAFLARPTVGFRFPFHENMGLFAQASYDFVPEFQMEGVLRQTDEKVEIGSTKVDISCFNFFFGLSFTF